MFDTKYTEKQYAFQLFDFAAEKNELKPGSGYLSECRRELIKLVDEQVNSANFWHDRYIDLAKEVMRCAGLPDTFADYGLNSAFTRLGYDRTKEKKDAL